MRIPIHRKIFGLSLSGLVLCTFSLGSLALYFTNSLLQKNSQEFLENKLAIEQSKIFQKFNNVENYTKNISESILSDIQSIEYIKQDSLREQTTNKINQYFLASLKSTMMTVAAYLRYNPKISPPTSGIFITKLDKNGEFENITPTDFSKYDEHDVEHVGWYFEPIKRSRAIWMEPYQNKNIDVNMISYVIPLFKNGEEIGVVGLDLDFNDIINDISNIKLYKTGHAFLESKTGSIITHPKLKAGDYLTNSKDTRVLRSHLPNGMIFGLSVPEGEINAERFKLLEQIALFAIFLLIIFSFISAIVAYSITKPILKLTITANKLINGDMKTDFTAETNDEIGDLSKSFQAAKMHMQKYLNQIQGIAFRDPLTGIRNKTAYDEFVKEIDSRMTLGQLGPIGIIVCNINNLKNLNSNCGVETGNANIVNSSNLICKIFSHSPVFRTSGNEFIVVLQNNDFQKRDELLADFHKQMSQSAMASKPSERLNIACGYSIKGASDINLSAVQRRAEKEMERIKKEMKLNF